MKPITSKDYAGKLRILCKKTDNTPVCEGDEVTDFRGDQRLIKGGQAPKKPNSEGHISLSGGGWYYAGVCDLYWK